MGTRRQAAGVRIGGVARDSSKPFKESNALNKKKADEMEGPVKARVFTRLFYRHWDDYVEESGSIYLCAISRRARRVSRAT